ncbi:hypothetical protein MJH12_06410 [bacterium]|nr:hypothetical protein [bacterium]
MNKYKLQVVRTILQYAFIEVEAESAEEAERLSRECEWNQLNLLKEGQELKPDHELWIHGVELLED